MRFIAASPVLFRSISACLPSIQLGSWQILQGSSTAANQGLRRKLSEGPPVGRRKASHRRETPPSGYFRYGFVRIFDRRGNSTAGLPTWSALLTRRISLLALTRLAIRGDFSNLDGIVPIPGATTLSTYRSKQFAPSEGAFCNHVWLTTPTEFGFVHAKGNQT